MLRCIGIAFLLPSFIFPILNWISLSLLIAEVSIDLYIAKNGDTVKERHQAAIDAGVNSVGILIFAFLGLRSLKLCKNQNPLRLANPNLRATATKGRHTQSFIEKSPVAEEMFFGTTKPIQVWNITASNNRFQHLDVKAWFLDEQFLLFTGKINKADHLIISSHGGTFPKSGTVQVPRNTELVALGPHGWILVDPKTTNIAKGNVLSYGIINENTALPTQVAFNPSLFSGVPNTYPQQIDAKILAGTSIPGHIRNYTLSKYQKFGAGEESYLDIMQIVNRSRNTLPIIEEIGLKPVDILTIRNRVGKFYPNLEDVFKSLQNNGVQYKKITLAFCRSKILGVSSPVYVTPIL